MVLSGTKPGAQKTLVALRALGLGDFLCGVPAYHALARAFPHHRRILALPRALHPLTALLEGAFHEAVDVAPLGPLPAALGPIDVAVNLHGSGPQSHRVLLRGQPRRLIAFAHPEISESAGGPHWDRQEHERGRWCRLLRSAGIEAAADTLSIAIPALDAARFPSGAAIVHPGAASGARRWPAARFAATARALAAGGPVLVTGTAEERELAQRVAVLAGLRGVAAIAGQTSLLELAALVARARCVISGDTGIAHLASAYGTPSILLFGPTSPASWGPPARPQHRVLWSGSVGDPHTDVVDAGLLTITVEDVLGASSELGERFAFAEGRASLTGGTLRKEPITSVAGCFHGDERSGEHKPVEARQFGRFEVGGI